MSKTNEGLVAFCNEAARQGLGYVYGTFGQKCTVALLDQKAKQYPANNLAGGAMRKIGEKWLGSIVVDCSGLIKYYLMAERVGDVPKYNAQFDVNLFNAAKEKGTIDTMPDIPGICLYMPGHTAVYVGNGVVIEAAGTAYGVVKSKLPSCYTGKAWTHWYKAPGVTYSTATQIKGLSLDTSEYLFNVPKTKDIYDVLARCQDKPIVKITGLDIIQLVDIFKDDKGRGWKVRIKAIRKPVDKPLFAHITVAAAGAIRQCNFKVI